MKTTCRLTVGFGPVLVFALMTAFANAEGNSRFSTGVTFTQYSLDGWGNAEAIARGKSLLSNSTRIVNQHIMGFGAVNPEPSPDDYQFESIDRRIGKTNGAGKAAEIIVLTACCAPDWMKGGSPGSTDWDKIEVAPYPEYFDDYAELIAEIVKRPEYSNIRYVQVWNEMKGFWDRGRNRWNHESYTELYNKVWDAVKAVRPDILIGGPYVVLNSFGGFSPFSSEYGGAWGKFDYRDLAVFTYWLKHKKGADFIIADAHIKNRDGVKPVSDFERTAKFADFVTWLRALNEGEYPGARSLPLWYAEWYAMPDDPDASNAQKNALMATGMIRTIRAGVAAALVWGPQGDANGQMFPLGLFSDTRNAGGGVATLFHQTQKHLHDHFASGTPLVEINPDNASVEVLASNTKAMLVNMTGSVQAANVDGQAVDLAPWQVSLVDRAVEIPTLSISDAIVLEDEEQAAVSIGLSAAASRSVDVVAYTRPDTARPGEDYYGGTEVIRFSPGQVRRTFAVKILNDIADEPDETIAVQITDPVNANIEKGSAVLTIKDNDTDGSGSELALESTTVRENAGFAQIAIRLSRASQQTVSVRAFTQIVSAEPGSDYYGVTTMVSFSPGERLQTFSVQILDDTEREQTETIKLRINDAQGATIAGDQAILRIEDND